MSDPWSTIVSETNDSHSHWQQSADGIRENQNALLHELLKGSEATQFGHAYAFSGITASPDTMLTQFQSSVPIQDYAAIEPFIQQQMTGVNSVVADEVVFYERTGGSSGGAKFVPYTSGALRLLQAAVEPWLNDLIRQRPGITKGCAYWSVSPTIHGNERAADGTTIGAESDLSFLRQALQEPFAQTMVDLSAIRLAEDYEHWQKLTLLTLLMHPKLTLISVWSPTFLTTLLGAFCHHSAWLMAVLTEPGKYGLTDVHFLANTNANAQAKKRLKKALTDNYIQKEHLTTILWPQLDTISCWAHGAAYGAYQSLRDWFPGVHIQAKGLMATEGVVTIPVEQADYPVLAVNSGFFEFIDDQEQVVLPENLHDDERYRVLVSNASGFFRYDIGDQVRMRGFYKQLPMLEFVGRINTTSDLVGEKLTDSFVSHCLQAVNTACMLAPNGTHYLLFIDDRHHVSQDIITELDQRLCENPQYHYARQLKQLGSIAVREVTNLAKVHMEWQQHKGQLLGDIKPVSLCTDAELSAHLLQLSQ